MAKAPAKAQVGKMGAGGSSDAEPETGTPEPAVMAAGASEENVAKTADAPKPGAPQKNDAGAQAQAAGEQEGFRDDAGRFTGNPPTDTERLDAICDLLTANGWSLPKVLHR
jgi:hypothetical protein